MIHRDIIDPEQIVVIGGSENLENPGGRVLQKLARDILTKANSM